MSRNALTALLMLVSTSVPAASPSLSPESAITSSPASTVEAEATPQREQVAEPASPARPAPSAMVAVRNLKIYPAF